MGSIPKTTTITTITTRNYHFIRKRRILNGLLLYSATSCLCLWIILKNKNNILRYNKFTEGGGVSFDDSSVIPSSKKKGERLDDEDDASSSSSNVSEATTNTNLIQELYDAVRKERLDRLVSKYKLKYLNAKPFPHIAIDGIFPEAYLNEVEKENPESLVHSDNGCLFGDTSFPNCFVGFESENKKSALDLEFKMGFYTRILFGVMKSSTFLTFLEDLTSIENLIADPHYRGSGIHYTASGGHLDVHADFNKYQQYGLDRRVNAFLYLNENWLDSYGGHLELWSRNMRECHQKILPTIGRFVVFTTTDFSYHGHPQPLKCPPNRSRRSMALYYYTHGGRPNHECINNDCTNNSQGHSTLFQKPVGCQVCEETTCYHVNKEEVPFESNTKSTHPIDN